MAYRSKMAAFPISISQGTVEGIHISLKIKVQDGRLPISITQGTMEGMHSRLKFLWK